jgi:ATP synthase E chain
LGSLRNLCCTLRTCLLTLCLGGISDPHQCTCMYWSRIWSRDIPRSKSQQPTHTWPTIPSPIKERREGRFRHITHSPTPLAHLQSNCPCHIPIVRSRLHPAGRTFDNNSSHRLHHCRNYHVYLQWHQRIFLNATLSRGISIVCRSTNFLQVLRYSALFIGVFYGFFHQSTLTAQSRVAKMDREYERKENLIAQAKAAWSQKVLSPEKKTVGDDSMFL